MKIKNQKYIPTFLLFFVICFLTSALCLLAAPFAFAAASLTVTGGNWEIGTLVPSEEANTTSDTWTITNDSGGAEDFEIKVDVTSGTWSARTTDNNSNGTDEFILREDTSAGKLITGTNTALTTSVADAGTYAFDLWFKAPPTGSTDETETLTVTLTATNWVLSCSGLSHTFNGDGTCTAIFAIAASEDDAGTRSWGGTPNDTVSTGANMNFGSAFYISNIIDIPYMRWSVDLFEDAVITNAYITLYGSSPMGAAGTWTAQIESLVEDGTWENSGFTYANYNQYDDALLIGTAGTVGWTIAAGTWGAGELHTTSNIASLVQTLVNGASYASGDYLGIRFARGNGVFAESDSRTMETYDGAAGNPPKLTVIYEY